MLTIPTILTDYSRAGAAPVYIIDIEPSAADSWTAKRFSEGAVIVDGNSYSNAIIKEVSRITHSAKITQRGGIGTFPSVSVKLLNKNKLHETFLTDNIENRKVSIRLTAIGPNRILNSSFESHVGNDFANWTEVAGGGGAVVEYLAFAQDGVGSARLAAGFSGEEAYVRSSTFKMKRGEHLHISLYATNGWFGTSTVKVALNIDGMWFNATTRILGGIRILNQIGSITASPSAWFRFSMDLDYSEFADTLAIVKDSYDCYIDISSSGAGNDIAVDAVQVEANRNLSPYHHNRYEMTASDCITVFTGLAQQLKWTPEDVSFELEAWTRNKNRLIPITLIGDGVDVPENSRGKPYPMTYGSFMGDGSTIWGPANPNLSNFMRGILTDGKLKYIYFDRPSTIILYGGTGQQLYCWKDPRYFEQMYRDDAGYATATREWKRTALTVTRWEPETSPAVKWLLMGRCPWMANLKGAFSDGSGGFSNIAYSYDAILSTYAYVYQSTPSDWYLELKLENHDGINSEDVIQDSLWMLGDFLISGGTGTASIRAKWNSWNWHGIWDPTGSVYIMNAQPPATSWRNTPIKRSGGDPAADKLLTQLALTVSDWDTFCNEGLADLTVQLWVGTGSMSGSFEVRAYEVGVRLDFLTSLEETDFAGQMYGRAFEDTWGGRKTYNTLIESAPEAIEHILRLECGAATGDINTTSFDSADSMRSVALAGQLHKQVDAEKVIDSICSEFGLLYYVDVFGKHTLLALAHGSSVRTLGLNDFINPLQTLRISRTPRDAVVNSVNLRYDSNQFTEDYSKLAYCNRSGRSGSIPASYQTKCSDSYAAFGNVESVMELSCAWINTPATAEAIIEWIIDWNSMQKIIVDGVLILEHLDLQIGDRVALDVPGYLPSSITSSSVFMVMETQLSPAKDKVTMKLLEVKEP